MAGKTSIATREPPARSCRLDNVERLCNAEQTPAAIPVRLEMQ
jgi:hypothetical protein